MDIPNGQFKHIVILGDSLSDRGTFKTKRSWLGPMILSGSPKGRFTDADVWGDVLARELANQAIHKKLSDFLKKKVSYEQRLAEEADEKQKRRLKKKLENLQKNIEALKLERISTAHHRKVNYLGQRFVRSYAEGGLTTGVHSLFEWQPVDILGARAILSTMKDKINRLFQDDDYYCISDNQKKQTLMIEWSGANDLLTVNKKLSKSVAEKAVQERMKHVRSLVENGYTNVVLFNLPDFSLTPRFQARNKKEQQKAHDVSEFYNQRLSQELDKLRNEIDGDVQLDIYDVSTLFQKEIDERLKKGEDVFKIAPKTGVVGSGAHANYLFFDDVHPTAQLQNKIAAQFLKDYEDKIDISPQVLSAQELFTQFKQIAKAVGHCEIDLDALEKEKKGDYVAVFETLFEHSLKKPRSNVSKALKRGQYFTAESHPELNKAREKLFPALSMNESYEELYKRARDRYEQLCLKRKHHHRFLEKLNTMESKLEGEKGFLGEDDYEKLMKRMVKHTYKHQSGLLSSVFESLQYFTLKHPGLNCIRQEVVEPYRIEWEGMIHPESLYTEFRKRYEELDAKRGGLRMRKFLKELDALEAELSTDSPLNHDDYLTLLLRVEKHARKFPNGLTSAIMRASHMSSKIQPFVEDLHKEILNVPPLIPSFKRARKSLRVDAVQDDKKRRLSKSYSPTQKLTR